MTGPGLAAKVDFLSRPEALADGPVERVETHMSWVFLTTHYAIKLKKPVRYPYLDYSTIERRRRYCEDEVRLNRRLAPHVYLGVVPLVVNDGLAIGRPGVARRPEAVVDWLVVMRRLPAARMLSNAIASGAVTPAAVDAVADVLTEFYARADRVDWSAGVYRDRLHRQLADMTEELARRGADPAQVAAVIRAGGELLATHAADLDRRVAGGRIVDAHGDLRPEHICLEDPPVVIDCLEFSAELRALDVLSELAFLELECDRLGASWVGQRIIARYHARSGDLAPDGVMALYGILHACTRALLALRHLDDPGRDDVAKWRGRAADYLDRAVPCLHREAS